MLDGLKGMLKKGHPPAKKKRRVKPLGLDSLVNEGGRVDYRALKSHAQNQNEQQFLRFLGCPALVGSAVVRGKIWAAGNNSSLTKRFKPLESEKGVEVASSGSEALSRAVFPLFKLDATLSGSPVDRFTIGRSHDNDLIVPDYTVSKNQAVVRMGTSRRFFIKDTNATNPTLINGEPCGEDEVPLSEGETVQFGRFRFVLLSPSAIYAQIRGIPLKKRIEELINHLGRADYEALRENARKNREEVFVQLVRNPALVGSGLLRGYLSDPKSDDRDTKVFWRPDQVGDRKVTEMKVLERHIYPLVKANPEGDGEDLFTIGRSKENDMCMEDRSISTKHASIRRAGEGLYFMSDLDSTNGSSINKIPLGSYEKEISAGDRIQIGRFEFTFLFPNSLFVKLNR
ncbi:MAG: FHA domain-containing protein [Magnetococcales bacterium]|nr:FHA domain-containing protein [Magnetococcales bacterium]